MSSIIPIHGYYLRCNRTVAQYALNILHSLQRRKGHYCTRCLLSGLRNYNFLAHTGGSLVQWSSASHAVGYHGHSPQASLLSHPWCWKSVSLVSACMNVILPHMHGASSQDSGTIYLKHIFYSHRFRNWTWEYLYYWCIYVMGNK